MKVLIAKDHKPIIEEALVGLVPYVVPFKDRGEKTCVFKLKSDSDFDLLHKKLKDDGYNPYNLMVW